MSDLNPGDIIDVTIRGARVMPPKPGIDNVLTFAYEETRPGVFATIDLWHPEADSVTIERSAPAEWPPRAGDLWRDKHDELWFIHECPTDKTRPLMGRTTGGARWTDEAFALIEDNAPLTLVHREGGAR